MKYVCRNNAIPYTTPNHDFIDDYAAMVNLQRDSFLIDTSEVHPFIVNFISVNYTTDANIKALEGEKNKIFDLLYLQ